MATRHLAAARRYLYDRLWQLDVQLDLLGNGSDSTQRREAITRYQVVEAIGIEVDVLDSEALPSHEAVVEWLTLAGTLADDGWARQRSSPSDHAEQNERDAFLGFVVDIESSAGGHMDAPPYRRTLSQEELLSQLASVRKAWQLDKWGFWEPLQASAVNGQPTLVLREESFRSTRGSESAATAAVRRGLRALGHSRIYELREWTPSFERDVGTVRFEYVPCEGMFFSADLSWLIFASHESVVTLGGSIVTELRRSWDELNEHIWDGHF